MKSDREGTNGAAQPTDPHQLTTVSEPKLKANRENSKKSSGPKTLRGKAFSRTNALKHGLFAKNFSEGFIIRGEDPNEFRKLIEKLREVHQPVGVAEEFEVQRIAQSCWRLLRAGRYENAELIRAQMPLVEYERERKAQKFRIEEFETLTLLLEDAKVEIGTKGHISAELRERMFGIYAPLWGLWLYLEDRVNEAVKQQQQQIDLEIISGQRLLSSSVSLPDVRRQLCNSLGSNVKLISIVDLATTKLAIKFLAQEDKNAFESSLDGQFDCHAIPNSEVMQRLLRYEAAIERSLVLALDRLDRLQRRRKGQSVLPPVSERVTQ